MNQIKHIRLDKLKPPEFDSRITSSPEDDDELMESIKENGILLPLIVKNVGDGFEIVAGHRRFTQAGRAGLAAAPCIVTDGTGIQLEIIKSHENLKRLDLSHIDQGMHFAYLIKTYKLTEGKVSIIVGKCISYVSQHLALLHSDPDILTAVHDGSLNFSVARELNICKNPDERARLGKIAINDGASSPVVRSWVQESNRETENLESDHKELSHNLPPETPQHPLYPCSACEVPVPILKMIVVRLCTECHDIIFKPIAEEKQKLRMKSATETQETPPGETISTPGDPNHV